MKLCTVFHTLVLGSVLFYGTTTKTAAAENPPPADLIIYNAKVLTVDSNFTVAQAVAVRGDHIVAVGSDRQITKHFKGFETHLVNAQGHTVMPGLYDNQVDSYHASVSELKEPLPVLHSIAEAQEYIRSEAAKKPAGSWVVVERAYPTRLMEGRLPTKAELDAAAPKNPVYWNCGPVAVVNTKALEVSRITVTSTNPPGGEIVLDPTTRKPTGLLRNASMLLKLPPAAPAPTVQQRRNALKHLYELYNEKGITSIGERDAGIEAINLFRDLSQSNELTVRINCSISITPGSNLDETVARLNVFTNTPPDKLAYGPTGVGDEWVRIGTLCTRMDGDVLSGTAYLRTPWGIGPTYQITDPAYRGQLVCDPDLLTAFYLEAAQRGWQLEADCTGNAALDQLLNCFQRVQFKTDIRQRRFLIRQATFQAAEDWERCRELGLGAELEPAILYEDGSSLLKTLGGNRLSHFLALKSWFDQGLLIGGGSGHQAKLDELDSTNPWDPWLGLWITLARQTALNDGIYIQEQRLTREQAIRFYTINNARLHFEEENKGSLEPGKYADLILLDRDIMKCPVSDIRDTKVQLTLVGGKKVWEAKNPEAQNVQVSSAKE